MPLVRFLLLIFFSLICIIVRAQIGGLGYRGGLQGPNSRTTGGDSLQHRTGLEDSLTISFRYLDSIRTQLLDSNVLNLNKYFAVPYNYLYLGNLGSASRPILFTPRMGAGFDAGFHAYDAYQWRLEDTRFFQTTRPYTELGYIIASKTEQTISVLHTQNLKPTWNAAFEYRFISSPGILKNLQNTHHNIRFSSAFQTANRRYSGFFIWINNKISAGESGGITSELFLKDARYSDRFLIPTVIGGDPQFVINPFAGTNATGTRYKNTQLFFRHQYDFGQKDSITTDSAVVKLFYPRFRLQHNLWISNNSYSFVDEVSVDSLRKYYHYTIPRDTVILKDIWKEIKNEFALILFPEKKNQNQFLKIGAAYQMLNGTADNITLRLYNIYLSSEYRNRTRNKKWDINANGQLYLNGFNAGDYAASLQLQALVGKKFGYVQLGFQNTNRTPSFVFDPRSSYPLSPSNASFNKENITHLFASIHETKYDIAFSGHYYLIANYTYFDSFFHASQARDILNVLHLSAEKKFRLGKHWSLYSELHFQQPTGNVINLPTLFTRQRIVFEGNFFKNLFLATGLDIRYFSPFKADNYSPLTGQFFLQEQTLISNRPDVAAFLHFRIKSFNAFIRLENMNTVSFTPKFGFLKNNFAAPLYPTPGQVFRVGIKWGFVN